MNPPEDREAAGTGDAVREEIFAGLRQAFQPDKAANVESCIHFDLTGEGGFPFHALIQRGKLTFTDEPQKARVKMRMPLDDFLAMLRGTLPANEAFLAGKLHVGGNLFQAMRLAPVFRFGQNSPRK